MTGGCISGFSGSDRLQLDWLPGGLENEGDFRTLTGSLDAIRMLTLLLPGGVLTELPDFNRKA